MTGTSTQRRAYRSLQAEFFLLSALIMLWTPRIPLVKDALGLTNGELGRVLMAGGVAGLLFSKPIGTLVVRVGSKRVGTLSLPVAFVGYGAIGLATSQIAIAAGIVLSGIGTVGMFTAITTQAATHSHLTGRNTLNHLSAIANVGTLATVAVGSALLQTLTNAQYIVGGSALIVAVFGMVHTAALPHDHREDDAGVHGHLPWISRRVVPLYVLAAALMASTIAEFSANDWSSLFTRDVLGAHAPFYSVPFLAFQVAIVGSRLRADALGRRFGVARFVRGGAVLCAAAWAALLVVAQRMPTPVSAMAVAAVAFAFAGAGIGPIYPAFMDAVGLPGFERPLVLARLFSIVTAAFVFGPGVIGAVAQAVGLSAAMLLPPVMLAVAGLVGYGRLTAHHEPSRGGTA